MSIPDLNPFVPNVGIDYPLDTPDAHILESKYVIPPLVLDEQFPYFDTSLKYKITSTLLHWVIWLPVLPIVTLRLGLRIEGKELLKKHKAAFTNGALTVANHIHSWDFLCIMNAFKYRRLWYPAWADNFRTGSRHLIRNTGGIPVPETPRAMMAFMHALDTLHARKQWLHVYPESAQWRYFQPIRPFKRGAFVFAQRYNLPIIPMAFSYRPVAGLWKLFKKNNPFVTLRIGEPIFPDNTLSPRQSIFALRRECHARMCALAGISDNPYPAEGD